VVDIEAFIHIEKDRKRTGILFQGNMFINANI